MVEEKVAAELRTTSVPSSSTGSSATVVFRSLTVDEIALIVDLMLGRVRDRLRAQQMSLEVTDEAKSSTSSSSATTSPAGTARFAASSRT